MKARTTPVAAAARPSLAAASLRFLIVALALLAIVADTGLLWLQRRLAPKGAMIRA